MCLLFLGFFLGGHGVITYYVFAMVYSGLLCGLYLHRRAAEEAKKQVAVWIGIWLLAFVLARLSYISEQRQYNERVFGYYASLRADQPHDGRAENTRP